MNLAVNARRKLPAVEVLRDLYVNRRLSTPAIASMFDTDARTVNNGLRRAGVTIRKKTKAIACVVDGCQNRAKKIKHPVNGSLYGTLCALHREEHLKALAKDYRQRKKSEGTSDNASEVPVADFERLPAEVDGIEWRD